MATVEIVTFTVASPLGAEAVRDLRQRLEGCTTPFILLSPDSGSAPGHVHLVSDGHLSLGQPLPDAAGTEVYHAAFHRSPFGARETASSEVVEMVCVYFPSSRVTPEFQKEVEGVYLEFDRIFTSEAVGNIGCSYGWTKEITRQENVPGEDLRRFVLLRGWSNMADFKTSTETEAFKNSIGLILDLAPVSYSMTFHQIAAAVN